METEHLACSVGIVICYQEISTEKEILEVELVMTPHIVLYDFSLRKKQKGALCTLFLAHFHLLFAIDTPTSIEFFSLFLCDSVLQLLLLVTWISGDHRIPKHRAITAVLYAVCDI